MIANRANAEILFKAALDEYRDIDAALSQIAPDLSAAELTSAKHAVGRVTGELLFGITEPILKVHPELLPEAWHDNTPHLLTNESYPRVESVRVESV